MKTKRSVGMGPKLYPRHSCQLYQQLQGGILDFAQSIGSCFCCSSSLTRTSSSGELEGCRVMGSSSAMTMGSGSCRLFGLKSCELPGSTGALSRDHCDEVGHPRLCFRSVRVRKRRQMTVRRTIDRSLEK